METAPGFEMPTWNQIYCMLLNQAKKINKSRFDPDIIVCIARGGWLPARVLSDLLENPNVVSVKIERCSTNNENKDDIILTQLVPGTVKERRVLLVDEVSDTGKCLKLSREVIYNQGAEKIKIATLYHKPWSVVTPDYYEKETDRWIVFPWERKETIRAIIQSSSTKGISI